eukprot:gene3181-87_t
MRKLTAALLDPASTEQDVLTIIWGASQMHMDLLLGIKHNLSLRKECGALPNLSVLWIKAHVMLPDGRCGLDGNDQADGLAKLGTTLPMAPQNIYEMPAFQGGSCRLRNLVMHEGQVAGRLDIKVAVAKHFRAKVDDESSKCPGHPGDPMSVLWMCTGSRAVMARQEVVFQEMIPGRKKFTEDGKTSLSRWVQNCAKPGSDDLRCLLQLNPPTSLYGHYVAQKFKKATITEMWGALDNKMHLRPHLGGHMAGATPPPPGEDAAAMQAWVAARTQEAECRILAIAAPCRMTDSPSMRDPARRCSPKRKLTPRPHSYWRCPSAFRSSYSSCRLVNQRWTHHWVEENVKEAVEKGLIPDPNAGPAIASPPAKASAVPLPSSVPAQDLGAPPESSYRPGVFEPAPVQNEEQKEQEAIRTINDICESEGEDSEDDTPAQAQAACLPAYVHIEFVQDLPEMQTFKDYRVVAVLGKGAYGTVLLAEHNDTGELRAIKVYNKSILKHTQVGDQTALQNVSVEIAIMKKIEHANVIKLYDVVDDPAQVAHSCPRLSLFAMDRLYMVLEYCAKGQISSEDDTKDPVAFERRQAQDLQEIFCQTLRGLNFVHGQKILHRQDLKPANVLWNDDKVVKLVDFGVSDMFSDAASMMQIHDSKGTPGFFAPETFSARDNAGPPLDIWALGATLYCCWMGKMPFSGRSWFELQDSICKSPVNLDGCPKDLAEVLDGMLTKDPGKRMTASQLLETPYVQGAKAYGSKDTFNVQAIEVSEEEVSKAILQAPKEIKVKKSKAVFPTVEAFFKARAADIKNKILPSTDDGKSMEFQPQAQHATALTLGESVGTSLTPIGDDGMATLLHDLTAKFKGYLNSYYSEMALTNDPLAPAEQFGLRWASQVVVAAKTASCLLSPVQPLKPEEKKKFNEQELRRQVSKGSELQERGFMDAPSVKPTDLLHSQISLLTSMFDSIRDHSASAQGQMSPKSGGITGLRAMGSPGRKEGSQLGRIPLSPDPPTLPEPTKSRTLPPLRKT